MDRVKFRAWDGTRMLNNVGTHPSMLMSLVGEPHYYEPYTDGAYIISNSFDSYTLMQFIDREDIEGVDMYEGDILRSNGFDYVIEWDDRSSAFRAVTIGNKSKWSMDSINISGALIVGNKFQNPELLKSTS